ncbi:MAG: hypothetical protein GX061_03325 [Eubacteriaceae bacterium]|nr:hypothetical protein [Eubacteriaceae bacterium]
MLKLARYIAGENPDYISKVIVEKEIGEKSVEDKVPSGFGTYSVTYMFSGCVCYAQNMNPELIISEATGVTFRIT